MSLPLLDGDGLPVAEQVGARDGRNALSNVNSTASRASAGAFCGEKSASREPKVGTARGIVVTAVASRFRFAPTGKFAGKCGQFTRVLNWVIPGVAGGLVADKGTLSAAVEPSSSVAVTRQMREDPGRSDRHVVVGPSPWDRRPIAEPLVRERGRAVAEPGARRAGKSAPASAPAPPTKSIVGPEVPAGGGGAGPGRPAPRRGESKDGRCNGQ